MKKYVQIVFFPMFFGPQKFNWGPPPKYTNWAFFVFFLGIFATPLLFFKGFKGFF